MFPTHFYFPVKVTDEFKDKPGGKWNAFQFEVQVPVYRDDRAKQSQTPKHETAKQTQTVKVPKFTRTFINDLKRTTCKHQPVDKTDTRKYT